MENVTLAGNIEYKKKALRELLYSIQKIKEQLPQRQRLGFLERATKKKLEAVDNNAHLNWEETCNIGS